MSSPRDKRNLLIISVLLAAMLIICMVPQSAEANGLRNPPDGAAALGRDGGKIAHLDDPSAITHNPANLVEIDQPTFMGAATIIYSEIDYDSPLGVSASSKDNTKVLPNLYSVVPLSDGDTVFGIGLTTPYGQSTEWSKTSVFRYTAPYFAQLITVNVNPTLAKRVGDNLSVGVGADIYYSELQLDQFFPWSASPFAGAGAPDGKAEFEGDGYGLGGNVGMTWQLTAKQRVAVTYRSGVDVDYDGDFKISNLPAGAAGIGATSRSDFESNIEFPNSVVAGYGIQLTDTVRMGVDVEWYEFSSIDQLELDIANNTALLPAGAIPQNWDDIWTFGIGGDWQFADQWMARASYKYLESPIPDSTFSPTIYDADKHLVTVGLGFQGENSSVDIAYAVNILEDRDINNNVNPAYNGDYEVGVSHNIGVSYIRPF